jgi:hypothetical protein
MHKCIELMFSEFMSMTFSVDIFTVFIYFSMYLFVYLYIHTYLCASDNEEHQWYYFRMDLCLLIMFVFVSMYVCIYVCMYVCMYICMYIYNLFPAIHGYKYNSYESILFHVPIGRRSQICSTGRGCGRGWEDIVGEARPC